ncbi:MAG: hypothetical protein H8E44_10350 [Planctomycetes bacterium]|nr:hypothetical protein [Planctomycetota bacterium]
MSLLLSTEPPIDPATGGWGNNAVDDSKLPADYLIDYVRVRQRGWNNEQISLSVTSPSHR